MTLRSVRFGRQALSVISRAASTIQVLAVLTISLMESLKIRIEFHAVESPHAPYLLTIRKTVFSFDSKNALGRTLLGMDQGHEQVGANNTHRL